MIRLLDMENTIEHLEYIIREAKVSIENAETKDEADYIYRHIIVMCKNEIKLINEDIRRF